MKKLLPVLLLFTIFFFDKSIVYADSVRSYQDYLYQMDVYRQKNNEFKIAKNEYEKFGSLTSQTTALDKTKQMLISRDQLLRSYLLLLSDKLLENKGLPYADSSLYLNLMRDEINYLESHNQLISSIATLTDAQDVSNELESHYQILMASVYQTIIGLSLGNIYILNNSFDEVFRKLEILVNQIKNTYPPSKQVTLERWILSIKDKKDLYERKINSITSANSSLKGSTLAELNKQVNGLHRDIEEAKAYLIDSTSFMNEVISTLAYTN